jgi:hypothetical protein
MDAVLAGLFTRAHVLAFDDHPTFEEVLGTVLHDCDGRSREEP